MRAALVVVALSALAVLGGAARTKLHAGLSHESESQRSSDSHTVQPKLHAGVSHESESQHTSLSHKSDSKVAWLTKKEKFCNAKTAKLECDDQSIIVVQKAFYQRRTTDDCQPEQHSDQAEGACEPNSAVETVVKCVGQRECLVEPADHPWCEKAPWTFFRVVYECVAGDPPTAVVDSQLTDNAGDEENIEFVPKKKRKDYVKGEVDKVVENLVANPDPEVGADFKTCYRFTRTSKILSGKFFDALTSCSSKEGCFKITFPDGTVFDKYDRPPQPPELAHADYVTGDDSLWLTFKSIGLQRNDFNTWGVCLPKGDGMDLAIATFNSIKDY